MPPRSFLERRYWILYPSWIAICALLFLALRSADDPSRSVTRGMDAAEAGQHALAALRRIDPARFGAYEVVHVTWAREDELGSKSSWVVLCDAPQRSALERAIVVEIDPATGEPLRLRRAVSP